MSLPVTDEMDRYLAGAQTHIRAALAWIGRSQDAVGGGGSSGYYMPLAGWFPAYPETTGYIIPTLIRAAITYGDPGYADRALRMAEWLLTLQQPGGAFPGGLWRPKRPSPASVFNTAQILFGLTAAAQHTGNAAFADAAERAAAWLISVQDADGRWRQHAYCPGFSPSYYAHVCWPMLVFARYTADAPARAAAERGLGAVLGDCLEDGSFSAWGFAPDAPAFTHTIAYTLQGLLESARLIGAWDRFGAPAADACERLMHKAERRRSIAGAYGSGWQGDFSFRCVTGDCQLASCFMRVYEHSRDPRFLNLAVKTLDTACAAQAMNTAWRNTHGAIPGSVPLWGRYLRFRYPNWAAKFFIDAMLDCTDHLARLAAPAPQTPGVPA